MAYHTKFLDKDYIYIPMGGSRGTFLFMLFNTIAAMTISGLWHGASYTFIIWGFCNGLIICIEKIFKYDLIKFKKARIIINIFLVFNLWVLFRCNTLENSIIFYKNLYSPELLNIFLEKYILIIITILMILFQTIDKTKIYLNFFKNKYYIVYIAILVIIFCMIISGQSQKFIYFDF